MHCSAPRSRQRRKNARWCRSHYYASWLMRHSCSLEWAHLLWCWFHNSRLTFPSFNFAVCLFCLLNIKTVDIRHVLHTIDRLHIPFLQSLLNHVPNIILQDDYCRGGGKLLQQVLKRPTKILFVMLIYDVILLMICSMCSLNTGIRKQAQLPLDKAVPGVWKYENHRLASVGRTYIF